MNHYREKITQQLQAEGLEADARYVEAWMREEFGTLSHLSGERFQDEVRLAVAIADQAGEKLNEAVARSLGL